MKVKKFIAPSMPEAMKMVRSELGKDAVILNSKVIQKSGIFGLFSKKNIEVIAAIDPDPVKRKPPIQKKIHPKATEQDNQLTINELTQGEMGGQKSSHELLNEIRELKKLMKNNTERGHTNIDNYPDMINQLNTLLNDQEFPHDLRKELVSVLLEKWYLNKGDASFNKVKEWTKAEMLKRMSDIEFGAIDFSKTFLNVVGPTGVGKTTTLAKIAAHSVLKNKKKVAFITTDTYRIAAIEQLKTYAQILDVPIEIAYNIDDFKKAKEKFSEYDLVLIDTAGRNFRNEKYVKDLKSVIDFDEELETFLVLSLTSKYMDMKAIVEQFSIMPIHKFIFTKVDETSKYGSMFSLILNYKIGVAYITNGQNVPDDIIEASAKLIVNNLFEVDAYDGSS